MGDVSLSVAGTDNDAGSSGSAMKWSASYAMGDMTLGLSSDNNGTAASTTKGSVSYVGGGLLFLYRLMTLMTGMQALHIQLAL